MTPPTTRTPAARRPTTDEDTDDGSGLFDGLEDAPDVDRDAISDWYHDLSN